MQHFHTAYSSTDRVTATSSETAFARTISLEALTIGKGDFYFGSAVVEAVGTNSTDTLTVKAYLGPASDPTTGILLASNTAVDVADGDNVGVFFTLSADVIGAAGTARFSGVGAGGLTSKVTAFGGTDAQVPTTSKLVIGVTATWSSNIAGNNANLDHIHLVKFPRNPSQ